MEPTEILTPIIKESGEEEENGERYSNRTLQSFYRKWRRSSRFPSFVTEEQRISEFGDSELGEPMPFQQIRIDFNPIKDVDDDEALITKCLDFWKAIEEHPEIQKLKVFPTLSVSTTEPASGATTSEQMPSTEATEWLGKEMIAPSLATKFSHKFCDRDHETYEPVIMKKDYGSYDPVSPCTYSSDTYNVREAKGSDSHQGKSKSKIKMRRRSTKKFSSRSSLINLCQEMEHWDLNHPKIMDPPSHTPILPRPILQKDY